MQQKTPAGTKWDESSSLPRAASTTRGRRGTQNGCGGGGERNSPAARIPSFAARRLDGVASSRERHGTAPVKRRRRTDFAESRATVSLSRAVGGLGRPWRHGSTARAASANVADAVAHCSVLEALHRVHPSGISVPDERNHVVRGLAIDVDDAVRVSSHPGNLHSFCCAAWTDACVRARDPDPSATGSRCTGVSLGLARGLPSIGAAQGCPGRGSSSSHGWRRCRPAAGQERPLRRPQHRQGCTTWETMLARASAFAGAAAVSACPSSAPPQPRAVPAHRSLQRAQGRPVGLPGGPR